MMMNEGRASSYVRLIIINLKIITMEYQCTQARFQFWNGQMLYTVQFNYSSATWYLFEKDKTSDAIFKKEIDPKEHKYPNRHHAENVLDEYLHSLTVLNNQ